MQSAEKQLLTAENLFDLGGSTERYELIGAELQEMTPTGVEHGDVESKLSELLRPHVRTNHLGKVVAGKVGFLLRRDPDSVLAADVAFIRGDHLTLGRVTGYFDGPPDLVVEIVSPFFEP